MDSYDSIRKWQEIIEPVLEAQRRFDDVFKPVLETQEKLNKLIEPALQTQREIEELIEPALQRHREIEELIAPELEMMQFYQELFDQFSVLQSELDLLRPAIEQIEVYQRFEAIAELGRSELVLWKKLPRDLLDDVISEFDDKDKVVIDWMEETGKIDELINLCSEELKSNIVFQQSIEAYNSGLYNVAALGFTSIIDRLLSEYSRLITETSMKNRLEKIQELIEDKDVFSLAEKEMNDFILYETYSSAMASFSKSFSFEKDEPINLNRHWLMHGRSEKILEKRDCVKLLTIIYGTILMGKLAS